MTIWPPHHDTLTRPVYHSLAQCLVQAVEAGEIAPGTRLPPQRTLAHELGLSVQTISRAYEELARLGIATGVVGRGTFVAAGGADVRLPWNRSEAAGDGIDCRMLMPVTGELHTKLISEALRDLAENLPLGALFSFRPRATLREHCLQAKKWLEKCGVGAVTDQIVPTNGNTQAMSVALMTVAMPGDLIVTEEIGHHTLPALASSLGLKLTGLTTDEEGILPEAFDRACRNGPVKALFVMPAGVGPTAATMGEERREAIVSLAEKHDVWILENDSWGPLQKNRPVPLAARAPHRTLYFTGLSKCILPGLRVAWLVVPESRISAARTRHLVTNWMATPLMAELATRWIADGTLERLLEWQRNQLLRRNQLAARIFDGVRFSGNPCGLHIWLPLPDPWREEDFVALARNDGVAIAAGASFTIAGPARESGVRICLGSGTESDLEQGLKVISRLVRNPPEPGLLAI